MGYELKFFQVSQVRQDMNAISVKSDKRKTT